VAKIAAALLYAAERAIALPLGRKQRRQIEGYRITFRFCYNGKLNIDSRSGFQQREDFLSWVKELLLLYYTT